MFYILVTKTVCFAGKRTQNEPKELKCEEDPDSIKLKNILKDEIESAIRNGSTYFILDMSLGISIWAAQIIMQLKRVHPQIKIEAVIPVDYEINNWSPESKKKYYEILAGCNLVHFVNREYKLNMKIKINTYMVNQSSLLIAMYDKKGGEAGATIRYANCLGLAIKIIPVYTDSSLR